jgi:hypothetical protein
VTIDGAPSLAGVRAVLSFSIVPSVSSSRAHEEVIVPPPSGPIPPLTHVRGTLITASLRTLGERGHLERYFASLAPEMHGAIRALIASSWVDHDVAFAHYLACDALHLAPAEILAIGAEVGARIKDTFLGSLFRVAREAGTTPWAYLARYPQLFGRICMGGAIAVYKLGPKEARVECYGLPGLTISYFRNAFRGANLGIIELFCHKAYVTETRAIGGGDWAYKASWV